MKKDDGQTTKQLDKVYSYIKKQDIKNDSTNLRESIKSISERQEEKPTSAKTNLENSSGNIGHATEYIRCPECDELIDMTRFKGLFFDEYLNRMPKKELNKLLAESLPKIKGMLAGEKKDGLVSTQNKKHAYHGEKSMLNGEPRFTMNEWLDKVHAMQYHQPLYKQLKAVLKEQNHWKDRKKGGSFKAGNPYRFTKD